MLVVSCLEEFAKFCAVERQLAANTVQAYRNDLADFGKWLASGTERDETIADTLKAYLEYMIVERKLAAATVRRRIACLRAFFRWSTSVRGSNDPFQGWRPTLPRRRRLPRSLSRPEARFLLSGRGGTEVDETLDVTIRLMISTGLRVGEVCRLRVEDVSPDGLSLRVHGKGSRDRIAYVSDVALRTDLSEIVRNRRIAAGLSAALFLNRRGQPIRPQSIRSKLRRVAGDAGIARRVTPHMLRHTAATLLIETGVDIRFVQRLLGHSSIATTEIYTHVSNEALRATLERADVLQVLSTR
jgi:site-specific recombinase XerD